MTTKRPRPVNNKADFYRRFLAGEFGNRTRVWTSLEEFRASGFKGLAVIRVKKASEKCRYDIPAKEVPEVYREYAKRFKADQLTINEAMNPADVLLNAEVYRSRLDPVGLYVFGSEDKMHMRPALRANFHHLFGLQAEMLLRKHLCPYGRDQLAYLLDAYPDHHIELTVMRTPVGIERGARTLIWEVRGGF